MNATSFINTLESGLQAKLVDVKELVPGNVGSIVSQWSVKLGINDFELTFFSVLLVSITLLTLVVGWYLRRLGKKKWLGYIISSIGFLPLLPIMMVGTLVYWMGKLYWKSGKVRLNKESAPKKPQKDGSNINDWEQALKGLKKLQS
ncbi:hypothetical protein PH210_22190 [Paenibacillus sp. BSR1-1]|uniref:hypothetical protein n=1 Tax=Paenibacillus sp. BSR1-1 TaxID=3020845 RepID=UPI0025B26D0D|nr:hypothetical protein [Paenibacillus sp. BSR1-1]MDN3018886.1 hypothetical protein [Paenibacillus sp. BSR1-1]